jgi:hypothetical protein
MLRAPPPAPQGGPHQQHREGLAGDGHRSEGQGDLHTGHQRGEQAAAQDQNRIRQSLLRPGPAQRRRDQKIAEHHEDFPPQRALRPPS